MDNVIKSAEQAEQLTASFVTRISHLEEQVTERQTQAEARAAKYGELSGAQDGDVRSVVRQVARDIAKREATDFRRELAATTEVERVERLKALAQMEREASGLAPMFESPVQLLSRQGLGSAERSRYTLQLATAGPRELQNYATFAQHKRDKLLAAAVVARLDTLPRNERPFKAAEFAQSMVGDEFDATRKAFERIKSAVQRAVNANRDFERGRMDATSRISVGLAKRSAT